MGVGAFAVAGGEGTDGFLIDQISGILFLMGALGGCCIALLELVRPLARKHGVVVGGGQGVGNVLLDADAVAAVVGLTVDDIPSDAEHGFFLPQN